MARNDTLEVGVAEVVDYLRLTDQFQPALREVMRRKVAVQSARDMGLGVTTDELQKAVDVFRANKGLHKVADTNRWMRANGITLEALEDHVETSILVKKLKEVLEKKVPQRKILAAEAVRAIVREAAFDDFIEGRL